MQVGDVEANGVSSGGGWWAGDVPQPPVPVSATSPRYGQNANAAGPVVAGRSLDLLTPQLTQPQQFGAQVVQALPDAQVVSSRMQAMPPQAGYDTGGVDESQQQAQAAGVPAPGEYLLPHTQLELGHSMARAPYPYADPYFGSIVAAYGTQAMIHPHMLGVQQARMPLPSLPSDMVEEEPVYVNAKQYHGILRRRQSRAKAESENKVIKSRKPYLHESRHLHALRRARGCGGRFLNTKAKEEAAAKAEGRHRRSSEGHASEGNHTSDAQASHSGQGMMVSNQAMQDGGLSSQGVSSLQQMGQYHTGILGHNHVGMISGGNPNVGYHSHHQSQAFHPSAFHPLPGSGDGNDGGQGSSMVSNGSQQTAVATQ